MPGANITREEARLRSSIITVTKYDITLDITGTEETFYSKTVVHFDSQKGASSFIDLIAPEVLSINLNGKNLPLTCFADSRISLTDLQTSNELIVEARCKYMNSGEGLHRFIDPADNNTYLYTQFEVADSRRVFAVFEQPDMKCNFTFHISAPKDWLVLSNSPAPAPSAVLDGVENPKNSATWHFSPTERISSYLTAIVAGPYKGKTSSLTSIDGREIPLGVYCRASLVEHLEAEEIFDTTKRGFAFFEEEFGFPYPFRKYDQIFVAEFNAGAMENAGCVTFRDSYVFRSRPSETDRATRANTILHELAHMWFGDLVTMRWWNDLWLNESFADYMSHLCSADATRWNTAWESFLSFRKTWGLAQDQLPSTHPIVTSVDALDDVWANFDGITYAKGASTLKQLVAYVGRSNFMKGLSNYFKNHAWDNTVLGDLLSEIESASGKDLHTWSRLWIEHSGANVIRPVISEDENGKITELQIVQELGNSEVLRPHRLGIGFYNLKDGRLKEVHYEEVSLEGESVSVTSSIGHTRPDIVLVNDGDLTYCKVRFDEKSWQTILNNGHLLKNGLARSQVILASWDMCRNGEIPASEFIPLMLRAYATEKNPTVLPSLLQKIQIAADEYISPDHSEKIIGDAGAALLAIADHKEPGSDAQFLACLRAASLVRRSEDLERVRGWLDGKDLPKGFTLDTDSRWKVVASLAAAGIIDREFVEKEKENDPTNLGKENALLAIAAIPTSEAKEEVYKAVVLEGNLPNSQQRNAITGFNASHNIKTLEPFAQKIIDSLTEVWEKQTYEMAQQIASYMIPVRLAGNPRVNLVGILEKWIKEHEDAAPVLRRFVSESLDTAYRIARNQEVDAASMQQ